MATTDERMRILKMIQEGKITAEEGSKLLAALREGRKETRPPTPPTHAKKGWLRIRVTDMNTGRTKVNVNLPLSLVDAGRNSATQYAPDVQCGPSAEAIRAGDLSGKIVDVMDEDDGEHVEVFID